MESIPPTENHDTRLRIRVCMGSSCYSRGNGLIGELAQRLVATSEPGSRLSESELSGTLCEGRCKHGPIVVIDGTVHERMTPGILEDLLAGERS